MVYAQPRICPGERHTQTPLGSRNFGQTIRPGHPIYPTPPIGQDMTQGQFLSGV